MTVRAGLGRAVAATVLAAALAGCGIPVDGAPQDVEDDALTAPGAAASDLSPTDGGQRVYFVAPDSQTGVRLQQVRRNVPATPNDVLGALFKGLTDTERTDRQLTTLIPVGTKLLSVETVGDGRLVIDVDATIFEAKRTNSLATAVAQIVYTATSLPTIERVRLLVDGQPQEWTVGDGRDRAGDLTPLAYPTLYPSNEPDLPPVPSPTVQTTVPGPPSPPPVPAATSVPPAGDAPTTEPSPDTSPDTSPDNPPDDTSTTGPDP
jgi:Sporulation and spore germination